MNIIPPPASVRPFPGSGRSGGGMYCALLVFLLGYGAPALPAAATGTTSGSATVTETAEEPKDAKTQLHELEKKFSSLEGDFEEVRHEIQSNTASLGAVKSKVEETATRLYESRSRNLVFGDKLEQALARLESEIKVIRAKAEEQVKEATRAGKNAAGGPQIWGLLSAAALAFLTPLGLACVEASHLEKWALPQAGLRNLWVAAVTFLAYATLGCAWMYGEAAFGELGFSEAAADDGMAQMLWLYRTELAVVAGMVATSILSDRLSLAAYGFLALLLALVVYPLFGQWAWGGQGAGQVPGWLEGMGFLDFAGATVMYSSAAWFALAWAMRFPMARSHGEGAERTSPAVALLGLAILWPSGFGLVAGHADGQTPVGLLLANLSLAAAAAVPVALGLALLGRGESGPLHARIAAGVLGGWVAVSAGVDRFAPIEAIAVGAVAALLHGLACRGLALWPLRQDHAAANLVAAFGVCGAFGTLCVGALGSSGAFAPPDLNLLGVQATGVLTALGFGLAVGLAGALLWQGVSGLFAGRAARPARGGA